MATTLIRFLPPTRSGRTFAIALSLLAVSGLIQLLVLAGYLIGGGVPSHRAVGMGVPTTHSSETIQPGMLPGIAPAPFNLVTPAPTVVASVETPALLLVRPTPAPAAHSQNSPTDLVEQARQLRSRGDTNSALARLREAEVAEPDSPQIVAEMALTYEAMQMPDRAFEQWQRIYNLGEGVGALYNLAESRLHTVPTAVNTPAANVPKADTSIPTDTSGFQGQGDTVLKLTDIHMEAVEDPAAEQKVTLKIVVKNRPGTAIDPNKVKILTYFYDLVDGKDIVQTNAQTEYAWLTPGRIDWANDKSEVLQTTYTRLKVAAPPPATAVSEAASPGRKGSRRGKGAAVAAASPTPVTSPTKQPVRTYLGYSVQLYYDRQLQDVQADPIRLLQQFPAPLTLPAE